MNIEFPGHPEVRSRVRWKILALMCAVSFVSYVLRSNLSVVGETMMDDLGFTEIQLGFALSAFIWGYAIFQFPGGVFGDIVGSRNAITIIAVLWGIFTLLTGFIPGPSLASPFLILITLMVVRFFVGVSQAPIFPVIGGAIANWFPVSGWGLPNGLTSAALTLGAAAAAPLLVWFMQLFGWRESFFLTAPLGFVIAALWWWYVRDYPAEHRSVNKGEAALIDAGRLPPLHASEEKGAWKLALKNRDILLLTLSYFCMNYVFYLFFNWFFFYLIDVREFQEKEAGYLTAAQWMIGAIGAIVGGFLCDRFAKRYGPRKGYRMLPVCSLLLSAAFLLMGATASAPYLAVTFLAFSFGCTQLTEGSYWAAMASISERHASAAGGVLNTGGNVVGAIGAVLVPFTAGTLGWVAAVGTGSLFAVIGALLWLFIRADLPMIAGRNIHPADPF